MTTISVKGAESATSVETEETEFDAAVENAQNSEFTPEMQEMMIEGAIKIGGNMILMPLATNILKEGMSDE